MMLYDEDNELEEYLEEREKELEEDEEDSDELDFKNDSLKQFYHKVFIF